MGLVWFYYSIQFISTFITNFLLKWETDRELLFKFYSEKSRFCMEKKKKELFFMAPKAVMSNERMID